MNTRRRFITIVPLAGAALLTACGKPAAPAATPAPAPTPAPPAPAAAPAPAPAPAAAPAAGSITLVDPAAPEAVALAYTPRGSESKHAKYAPPAACGNCVLYAGKTGDETGPCPLFVGKHVTALGWCSAYNKRG